LDGAEDRVNDTRKGEVIDRLLPVVAGSLGLLSISLPWVAIAGFGIPPLYLPTSDFTRFFIRPGMTDTVRAEFSVDAVASLAAILILLVVGSIVNFFRPGGGVLILIAWLGFVVWFYAFIPDFPPGVPIGYGAGFYLAVVASIVSLSRYALKPFLRPTVPLAYPGVPVGWHQNPPPPP
jgi:hypothetical protein